MKFSLDEIIKATGAKILKNETANGEKFTFSTDTRTIKKGEIYLPLKGENFNGEDFIDKALEKGAVGFFIMENGKWKMENDTALVEERNLEMYHCEPCRTKADQMSGFVRGRGTSDAAIQRKFYCEEPCLQGDEAIQKETIQSFNHSTTQLILQVENTLIAYLELARFYKRKIAPKTVAITGSSGKTTTKEMAFCVGCEKFKTHKSELNFNNEIGLCKTILSMPPDTEVLILEMGMRGLGEIELLSKYSEPDIAIIANVGTAHIGRLGSRENIAKAKCEVVKYLKDDGVLIAHDDKLIKDALSVYRLPFTVYQNYFSLENTKIVERKIGYTKFEYENYEYKLNIEGDYNVQNSLAAIEMGLKLGMSEEEIASGLKKYSPIQKRWEVEEVKGYKIINDSYNANPESMKAAIETFLTLYTPPLLLVLGDMAELGDKEIEYHKEIGDFLVDKIKENVAVVTVGNLANEITKKLNEKGFNSVNFSDNLQTSRYILDNVKFGTTIILKASRSMKFEEIIQMVNGNQ